MEKEKSLDFYLYSVVGSVLKKMRIQKGYSLNQLADKIGSGMNKQNLSRYERAVMRMNVQTFKSICNALDEDPRDVWKNINDLYSNYNKSI